MNLDSAYAKVVAIGNSVNKEDGYFFFELLVKLIRHFYYYSITKDYPEVGDHVFVKAWAIDIINYQDKKYYFCNLDTNGVLAIVK